MLRRLTPVLSLAALVALASPLAGQTFSVRVQLPDQTIDATDGTTIAMPAAGIGQTVSATVEVTNRGAAATLNFVLGSGSVDFTVSDVPITPIAINPRGVFTFTITYKATSSNRVLGRAQFNTTVGNATTNFSLNLAGVAPEFVYSYTAQGANQIGLADGATIKFPDTKVDATSNATVIVNNRGSYQGTFNKAASSGSDKFETVNVPIASTIVDAGKEVRFLVAFTPKKLQKYTGKLALETADRKLSFNLEGSGNGPDYTYSVRDTPLEPKDRKSVV